MMHSLKIILIAPIEVIVCLVIGACRGAREGIANVRDAWREQ